MKQLIVILATGIKLKRKLIAMLLTPGEVYPTRGEGL